MDITIEKNAFVWVMDIVMKFPMTWFNWVSKGCGLEFLCEFGNRNKVHTGILLKCGDYSFDDTPSNRRKLKKWLKRIEW